MAAAIRDITIEVGATYAVAYTLQNGDGTIFDLTGYTGTAQVRETSQTKHPVVAFTCTVLSPATNGQLHVTLPAATTAGLKPGKYSWDLFITSSSQTIRLLQGDAEVLATFTR